MRIKRNQRRARVLAGRLKALSLPARTRAHRYFFKGDYVNSFFIKYFFKEDYANSFFIMTPSTSVSLKSRPWNL